MTLKLHPKQVVKPVPKPPRNTERYFSRAIGNALRVLEIFQRSRKPLTLTEASAEAKLPKSSVFRILRTLEIAGYLQRVEGERFVLTPSASTMPSQMVSHVVEVARPLMKQLGQEFRETISLAFLFENHIEVVAVIDSIHRVQIGKQRRLPDPAARQLARQVPHRLSAGRARRQTDPGLQSSAVHTQHHRGRSRLSKGVGSWSAPVVMRPISKSPH